jgi:hypothetical protein
MTWRSRVKDGLKGGLILLALAFAFFAWIGVLQLSHRSACNRLNAERLSHLEPGHTIAGPGSIYVKGVGKGPPDSELLDYLEIEAEMQHAGC